MRVATRFGVLLSGDLLALVFLRGFTDILLRRGGTAGVLSSSLLASDTRHFALLTLSTLIALFATGSHSRHRALNQPARLLAAAFLAPLPLVIPPFMHLGQLPEAGTYLLTAGSIWVAVLAVRQMSEAFLRHVWPRQQGAGPALLVGRPEGPGATIPGAIGAPGGDFAIIGHLSTRDFDPEALGTLSDLSAIVDAREVEAVVVCTELPAAQMNKIVTDCLDAGCQLLYPARAIHVAGVRPALVWHHDQPFFELGSPVLKARALISKRIVDVTVSTAMLLLLAPVLFVIAVLVRIDSRGPALFLQERAGLGGKKFRMIKFRTMRAGADAEKMDLAHLNHTGDSRLFKIPDDPRTTRVGIALRRWSFDELPQLWNVFIGDMSLVGPRPFFEADFPSYADHHFRRLDAKPGITGLWQVSGRSEILNFEDVIYLDRQYIEQWSFWLDVSILVRTVPAVLRRTGAF